MLKFVKYIENAAGKDAVMLLFGQIGRDFDGNRFGQELEQLSNIPNITSCRIKINSIGGNVYQGMSILSGMDILKEKGIPVITENVGVAYSMAGMILASGQKRDSVNYGTVMVHDPKFTFGDPEEESQKNMLQKMTDSLTSILENNSNLTNEQAKGFMGKETTFSATEALEHGLIDSIKQTGRKLEPMANHYDLMVACADIYNNKPITKNKKMSKLTDYLKLNEEANEDAILNAVKGLKGINTDIQALADDKTTLENSVKLLTKENATLKEDAVTVQAEALVNKAIEDGKIKEDGKDQWIENAKSNFESTQKLIEGLNVVPGNINDDLNDDSKGDKGLSDKYEALLDNPAEMDNMEPKELEAMEKAWSKKQEALNFETIQ